MKPRQTYVALLRAVNVGGKNLLPMKELTQVFASAGYQSVQTYIQSGNVVFQAADDLASTISVHLAKLIEARFGFKVPVIVRSTEQLGRVWSSNPFLQTVADHKSLHVLFLHSVPEEQKLATLETLRFLPDEYRLTGPDVYLYLPGGMGTAKLNSKYLETKLGVVGTARNWRTVGKLVELCKAAQDD